MKNFAIKENLPFCESIFSFDCCVACPVGLLIPFSPEHVATICHPSRLYLLMWKTQSLIKDA